MGSACARVSSEHLCLIRVHCEKGGGGEGVAHCDFSKLYIPSCSLIAWQQTNRSLKQQSEICSPA